MTSSDANDLSKALSIVFAALLLGLWLLRRSGHFRIWPVRCWGYLFYPGHLLVLQILRIVASLAQRRAFKAIGNDS
nr:TraX family protein [Pseudomonas izuensis]